MFCRIFFIGLQKNFLTQYSKNLIIQNHANDIEKKCFSFATFLSAFSHTFFFFLSYHCNDPKSHEIWDSGAGIKLANINTELLNTCEWSGVWDYPDASGFYCKRESTHASFLRYCSGN